MVACGESDAIKCGLVQGCQIGRNFEVIERIIGNDRNNSRAGTGQNENENGSKKQKGCEGKRKEVVSFFQGNRSITVRFVLTELQGSFVKSTGNCGGSA